MSREAEYWEEVERLFHEASGLDEAARAALLSERCPGRPDLRKDVESLLEVRPRAARFMERETTLSGDGDVVSPRRPGPGDRVGPFRLLEEIGAGGMASVYRAERAHGDFEHFVAVKLLDAPIVTQESERRFKLERQILASLRHPNVVTLLDGGVADDGRGFLAMEFVEGRPITTYCREEALSRDARLQLFRDVCAGVHYAHRHGIVHRDLKPSNILITIERIPKVLDFGIAKLMGDAPIDVAKTATSAGLGPMTPAYASPEQLRGTPVTTSSDIYSLGVLLYEIVCGHAPYRFKAT